MRYSFDSLIVIAIVSILAVIPDTARGARLYFKNGDFIEGRRAHEKNGRVYLEVVKGPGGTLIFKSDEIDHDKSFGRKKAPTRKSKPNKTRPSASVGDDGSDRPIVFSDSSPVINGQYRDEANSAEAGGTPQGRTEDASVHHKTHPAADSAVSVHVQPEQRVGFIRNISEKENDPDLNGKDATRYYGRVEKDGSAVFSNSEGRTLRGNLGNDGFGTVRDENLQSIQIKPKPRQ